jgi:hypothetical protein
MVASQFFTFNLLLGALCFWSILFYFKIETGEDEDESEGSDSECSDALDLSKVTEMRLVPSDPSQCISALLF